MRFSCKNITKIATYYNKFLAKKQQNIGQGGFYLQIDLRTDLQIAF